MAKCSPYAKIKVNARMAVEILRITLDTEYTTGARQSDDWLALYWQTLSNSHKRQLTEEYLNKTIAK